MSENRSLKEKTTSLPNKIPVDKTQLERTIELLGSRVKAELQTKARQELVELIGAYPSSEQASVWKSSFKQLKQQSDKG